MQLNLDYILLTYVVMLNIGSLGEEKCGKPV